MLTHISTSSFVETSSSRCCSFWRSASFMELMCIGGDGDFTRPVLMGDTVWRRTYFSGDMRPVEVRRLMGERLRFGDAVPFCFCMSSCCMLWRSELGRMVRPLQLSPNLALGCCAVPVSAPSSADRSSPCASALELALLLAASWCPLTVNRPAPSKWWAHRSRLASASADGPLSSFLAVLPKQHGVDWE